MSNSLVSSLNLATFVIQTYFGAFLVVIGVLGRLLNMIVFLSLRIYRKSSSAFYLNIVSFVNIGQLLTGLFFRVLFNIIGVDWTQTSLVYCKLRNYFFQACAIISPICLCLATIDQFLATSIRLQWQRWSNIKIARYSSILVILLWSLYGIPYLIYCNINQSSCSFTNTIYEKYHDNIHVPFIMYIFPVLITVIFGLLAYYNIRQLPHRTIPLVRRRHEVQLATMVLIPVIFNLVATVPSFIVRIIISYSTISSDSLVIAQRRFATVLTSCIYFLYYAIPFYIYIFVSERFRKQLHYVLIDLHLNRWRRRRTRNEIVPHIELMPVYQMQPITSDST